jgi:hypothetical protein
MGVGEEREEMWRDAIPRLGSSAFGGSNAGLTSPKLAGRSVCIQH